MLMRYYVRQPIHLRESVIRTNAENIGSLTGEVAELSNWRRYTGSSERSVGRLIDIQFHSFNRMFHRYYLPR